MHEKDMIVLEGMKKDRYGDAIEGHDTPILHRTCEPFTIARVAIEMASRWATVAAIPDGEDSSGRQKLRMQTPDELADHACAVASALWQRFEDRGWFFEIPHPMPKKAKTAVEAEA